jgi:cysteinyl-tRNA synthetase
MSMKYLGETFDIHCGGEDNIFPHHENEIAQSEAVTGKSFVKYWLHCGYLLVEGRKMSKSLGNFYTLKDLVSKGFSPKAIRYILLATHYRQQLNFTLEGLESATNALKRVQDFILVLNSIKKPGDGSEIDDLINTARSEFSDSLDNDLNIAPAWGAVFTFIREVNRLIAEENLTSVGAEKVLAFLKDLDRVLGLFDFSHPEADKEIENLIKQRNSARALKDWKASDEIRAKLTAMGIVLEDTKEGTRWKRVG